MMTLAKTFAIVDTATSIAYLLLAVAIVVALFYVGKFLWKLYQDFTAPGGQAEADIVNMFTPHESDGSIAPKNVPLKSADPIDWLFMHPDDSAPT